MPSRRDFIITGGKGLFAVAASPLWTMFTSVSGPAAGVGRSLTVSAPSNQSFHSQIDSHFPGLHKDPLFQGILPATLLVTNTSEHAIKALSVTWSLTAQQSAEQKNFFFYVRPGRKHLLSGARNLLGPGQTRLVTPFLTLNSKRFRKGKGTVNWDRGLTRGESRKQFMQQLGSLTSVEAHIDAVIYSDWVLTGPDSHDLANHLAVRRNAEHDEAHAILRSMKAVSGTAKHQVARNILKQHHTIEGITSTPVLPSETRKYWYYRSRTVHAKSLLHHLKKKSSARFVADLKLLRDHPKTTVHKQLS